VEGTRYCPYCGLRLRWKTRAEKPLDDLYCPSCGRHGGAFTPTRNERIGRGRYWVPDRGLGWLQWEIQTRRTDNDADDAERQWHRDMDIIPSRWPDYDRKRALAELQRLRQHPFWSEYRLVLVR
jgi:hypothetical protein